jgi:hypothetical protein
MVSSSNVQTTVVNIKDKSSGNTDTQPIAKTGPVENAQTTTTDTKAQTNVPTTDEKTISETKPLTVTKQGTSTSTDNTSKISDNLDTNINDVSNTTDAKTIDTDTLSNLEISKTNSSTKDSSNADKLSTPKDESLQLKALTAMSPEASKINSGNGWEVDQTGTNLNITGQLDESNGKDDTRWGGNSSTITTININNKVTAPKNSSYLFSDMPNLTAINNLSNFDTTTTENTEGMFKNDSSIESIDLSNNNLATINNASHMFENNSSLKTVTYPTKNDTTMNKIQDTSYMFANCISLTDPDVSGWQTHYINNMTAMFKNDANITDLNLQGWLEYAKNINTGDSSLGQGMFDGTDLQTITIGNSMYFSPETALTSKSGATWTNGSQKFLGVPITSDDGTVTGGIGSVYKGPGSSIAGAGMIASTYHAIAADPGTTVMNLITVPTNHGNITVEAQGNVGESSDVTLPETISVDGQTYITTAKTVKATFGQTMATADLDASGNAISSSNPIVYTGEPVVGTQKDIPTNLSGKITIDIPAGHVGDSIAVTIPKDQIPAGYHVVKPTINVTYTNDATNPYLLDTSSVELVGNDVTKWSTPQDAIELPTGSNITVTGTTNSNGAPVKIGDTVTIAPKVPGYTIKTAGSATVIADADGNPVLSKINQPIYSANYVTSWSTDPDAVKIPNGQTTVSGSTNSSGQPAKIGDTVKIAPNVPGYTVSIPGSATIVANDDGTPKLIDITQPKYSANPVNLWSTAIDEISIPTGKVTVSGSTNSDNQPAHFGDTVTIAPKVPGYTISTPGSAIISADKDGNSILSKVVQPQYTANSVDSWSSAADEINIPTGKITVSGSTNSDNQPAHFGDTVTIEPNVPGYTVSTPGSATIVANDDGTPKLVNITQPEYSANSVSSWSSTENQIIIPTGSTIVSGTTNSDDQPAHFGDKVTIAPDVPGYTISTPGSAIISADKDGNPVLSKISQPKYSADPVSSWSSTENEIAIPTGLTTVSGTTNSDGQPAKIGDTVTIDPDVPGYTITTPGSATIIANKNGNPILSKVVQPKYSANPVNTWSTATDEISTPTGKVTVSGSTNSDNQPAHFGDTVTIAPKVPGYTISKPGSATIVADKDGNPILSKINQPTYSANSVTSWSTDSDVVKIPNGQTTVFGTTNSDNQLAHIGDTVTIAPEVPGYTVSKPGSATIVADKDGNPILSGIIQPQYSANPVVAWSTATDEISIPTGKVTVSGTTNSNNQPAHTGDTVTIAPKVPGYTISKPGSAIISADKDGNPILSKVVQPQYTANSVDSWSSAADEINIPTGKITVSGTKNSDGQPAKIGDTVTITPEVPGYTISKPGSATIAADKDGNPVLTNITQPAYSANDVKNWSTTENEVITPTGKITVSGTTNSENTPAHIGDTVSIAPNIPGYTISKPGSATITSDKDGNPVLTNIIQPTYTANEVKNWSTTEDEIITPTGKVTVSGTTNSENTSAKIGDTVTIAPNVPGYTISKLGSAIIISDKNGNPVLSKVTQPEYSPNAVSQWSTKKDAVVTPNGNMTISGDKNATGTSAKIGDKISITPEVPGYTISKPGSAIITADKDGNPVLSDLVQPVYSPNNTKPIPVEFNTPNGKEQYIIPAGKVGDKVTVTIPNVAGYDPSTSEIKGTISANNTFIPDGDVNPADVKYLGKEINGQLSTVDVNLGNGIQSIKIPSGTVGSISGPIQLDYIEGYNRPAVKIQYTPNGFNILDLDNNPISKTSPVIYTGVKNPETSIKIQKPDGSIINVKVPEGHFGDNNVPLSLPSENGYITPSITVTYGPNGIPSFTNQAGQIIDSDNPVSYKGNVNKASTVKVKNPDGTTSTLNIPEGRFGDSPITVTAIDKPGYTAPKVIVTFNPDGIATITNLANFKVLGSDDVLSYTQIVSNESTSSAHIENIKSTIATFADQPDVQIYAKNSDNQMSIVSRKLVHNSDWLTDQKMTLNGNTFYRVATNEWVKASQVYLYKAETLSLQAKTDSDKQMIKAEGTTLSNLLAKGTQFTSDRIAYINGQEYYRVGINQFVKISDTEIVNDQNINLTVATFSDQPAVQVYALNNDQITPANRKLMPQTDWLVDRQTTISGQKFYRVATNEWIKASQVYPFVYNQTVVHTTAEKKLYTAQGNLVANRKLNSDSAWKVNRIAYLNDEKYFRVATNEFVKAVDLEKF